MRLIDADEFKRQVAAAAISNDLSKSVHKANIMFDLIDMQPTAYNVEAVIKDLENRKELLKFANIPKSARTAAEQAYLFAIDAVKEGGTNE